MELLQCLTNADAAKPYKFKGTGISVYSFEEVLFHCYKYWRQSASEICGEELINWTHTTLGLTHIAVRMREMAAVENFSQRFCAFLTITPFLNEKKINALRNELGEWENRNEWEKLKEQADYLMNSAGAKYKGNYTKAAALYKNALIGAENGAVLNNLAVVMLKLSRFDEACEYLERATDAEPGNLNYAVNYAQALIFADHHDKAWLLLNKIETMDNGLSEIYYFKGEINFINKQYLSSIPLFEHAIEIVTCNENKQDYLLHRYIYRLCDVYVKLRRYEQALEVLNSIEDKDRKYYKKQAEIYAAYGNFPAAVRCIESAMAGLENALPRPTPDLAAAELYTLLSAYYRMDYDAVKSGGAIMKAKAIAPDDLKVKLEIARVKRAKGEIKEYRVILSEILNGLKKGYREKWIEGLL